MHTETNYIANQAELDGYKECGLERYEFSAHLDNRTSEICAEMDGKVFDLKDAQAGTNLPPMHPFCRSSTVPVLPSEEELDRIIQQDGDAIGADVDFEEWKSRLVENEDGKLVYRVDNSAESGIIKESVQHRIIEYDEENNIFHYTPKEVEVELLKSDIGKRINEVIEEKNIYIDFEYSQYSLIRDNEMLLGQTIDKNHFDVYPNNCEDITEIAKTIIHETTHLELDTAVFTQREEVYCRLRELLHTQSSYDISDVKNIISEVKSISSYRKLKWRDKNGF